MIRIIFIIFLLFSSTAQAVEKDVVKTVIHDRAEAKLLLGRHSFTSYRLGNYDATDESARQAAVVYEEDGQYSMAGGLTIFDESKNEPPWGGAILLKGVITEIRSKGFTFEGTIDTDFFFNGKWYPCKRKGTFKFTRDLDSESRADHKGDFWRLLFQNTSDVGCDDDADTSSVDMRVERMPY